MKIKSLAAVVVSLHCLLSPCEATSVGTTTIEQPVNLGIRSDPTRIPLGAVGVICNHNYGLHQFIGAARPAPDGAMRWPGGSELDQNLASVFGISVEPEDPTQINSFPVILRVKSWKPPGYSPYTKEQVLAASLWCLIRSAGGTPERPLDVRVVAEGEDDKALEAKYSGKYVTRQAKDGEVIPPLNVAGTLLEEDTRGIAWVVFPDAKKDEAFVPINPSAIILKSGGDGGTGWYILPVWGNRDDDEDFLRLNHWSSNICYSSFKSHGTGEANTYLAEGGSNSFSVESGVIALNSPRVDQTTLAANLLALVISKRPTEAKPLTISFTVEDSDLANYAAFQNAEGWTETRQISPNTATTKLECQFAWDPLARKLTKGSVPFVRSENTSWISPNHETLTPARQNEMEVAETVAARIKSGIDDGTLLSGKIIPPEIFSTSGSSLEIAKAGYYQALAVYSYAENLPKPSQLYPIQIRDSHFAEAYRIGWMRGLAKCQEIVAEVLKPAVGAKPVQKPE